MRSAALPKVGPPIDKPIIVVAQSLERKKARVRWSALLPQTDAAISTSVPGSDGSCSPLLVFRNSCPAPHSSQGGRAIVVSDPSRLAPDVLSELRGTFSELHCYTDLDAALAGASTCSEDSSVLIVDIDAVPLRLDAVLVRMMLARRMHRYPTLLISSAFVGDRVSNDLSAICDAQAASPLSATQLQQLVTALLH